MREYSQKTIVNMIKNNDKWRGGSVIKGDWRGRYGAGVVGKAHTGADSKTGKK